MVTKITQVIFTLYFASLASLSWFGLDLITNNNNNNLGRSF